MFLPSLYKLHKLRCKEDFKALAPQEMADMLLDLIQTSALQLTPSAAQKDGNHWELSVRVEAPPRPFLQKLQLSLDTGHNMRPPVF
jgi:hypothetical protein